MVESKRKTNKMKKKTKRSDNKIKREISKKIDNKIKRKLKKKKENKTTKKLLIASGLILVLVMYLTLITAVEAVTITNPNLDAASLQLSLFKKTTAPTTGRAIDDSGNTIATVTIKAGEEVGRVRDDFYGVNTHGYYLGNWTKVDLNHDGNAEENSDLNWHRQMLLESNIKYIRWDAGLQNYYFYNESSLNYYFNGDLSSKIDQLKWAQENNINVLLTINYMPHWLADTRIEGCNLSKLTDCPPYNYSIWENIILDYLDRLTEYGKYSESIDIEVWNEPYGKFWLSELQYDDIKKTNEYLKLYNSTYNAIKSKYPAIKIGGPSGFRNSPKIISEFLDKMANQSDFVSIHPYGFNQENKLEQVKDIKDLLDNCVYYNKMCFNIIISEWNVGDVLLKNEKSLQNRYGNSISHSYISVLNEYPSIVSMMLYQWSEVKKYSPDTKYPEYPQRWSMVSEAGLDNPYPTYYPSYNVTKDFAHYHAGGNMIVNSSSNNNSIKSVASLNPQGIWHITVINTATNNINVSIDVSSTGVEAIKDLATGTIYIVNNGIANVGILTEYDVKHYEGIANYEVEENTPASVGGSSPGKNKLVSVENLNINPNEFAAIQTDTSKVISTSDIFANTNTNTNNENNKKEKEEFYGPIQSEEAINEIAYKARTGSLSLAVSNNSYLVILIILLASIICTALIISIIYRKKKREADKVKKLMDWVDKARALGYTPEKMKEMLAQYNWDKDLVEKVIGK